MTTSMTLIDTATKLGQIAREAYIREFGEEPDRAGHDGQWLIDRWEGEKVQLIDAGADEVTIFEVVDVYDDAFFADAV